MAAFDPVIVTAVGCSLNPPKLLPPAVYFSMVSLSPAAPSRLAAFAS